MTEDDARIAATLARPRYELIPMRGVESQLAHLPATAVVTVTASPTRGLESTLELTRTLVALGHHVVPHLSARLVEGPGHLDELLAQLGELRIHEVFVIAGDATQPAGPYEGAGDLLEAIAEDGRSFAEVGISGYPETHGLIPDATTIAAMHRKAPHATYIVSQICFEPTTTRRWVRAVRARGITLPIYVGLPGVVDRARLLRLAVRVGLGDSVKFLSKQARVGTRLLAGYEPDDLVYGLIDLVGDPVQRIAGWHLFTFNEVERTEDWRRRLLATTQGAAL
jgi:methylenetetrahydrofolate reductase (NADPH)